MSIGLRKGIKMADFENEKQEIIEWLKHPNELGKAPSKIEYVKEFTDEEGAHCLIFRFKPSMFSKWLMAIHSDAGIFSEQEEYEEANDIEQATKMLEYLKQYWKNVARNEEEKKERAEKAKNFHAFILKKEARFEPNVFLSMYEKDWGEALDATDGGEEDRAATKGTDALICTTKSGLRLVLGYMDFAIPGKEAEANAAYNYMWREAVEVAASHLAHEVIYVAGDGDIIDKAFFYSKVIYTLCKMDNNIGLYANGVVYEPAMVVKMCELVKQEELPIPILVWCGLGQEENGLSAWTDGMKCFGFDEMEIVGSNKKPSELQGFVYLLVDYCIKNNVGFHDGETVALTASVQLLVEKSKGFNVDEDGETLKINLVEGE